MNNMKTVCGDIFVVPSKISTFSEKFDSLDIYRCHALTGS